MCFPLASFPRALRTLTFALGIAASLGAQTKLLHFPDIHNDKVAFTHGGDIWTAPSNGGTAVRLTAHPGLELFAKFSPDGKWIAFTGQYDGDEQVYVMPATGGVPKQLTFYPARGPLPVRWGYDNQVYGWTPDGTGIVFRSYRESWSLHDCRLYVVPMTGGLPVALEMPESGAGDLSPDAGKVIYSPLFRDFRSWKRYQGGWAADLFIFDRKTKSVEPVSQTPRTERDPMWIGNKIFFASDRTGTLNLFEYDIASKKTKQVTNYADWDVRWPSKGDNGEIVFELNGELAVYDTKAGGAAKRLKINVPNDGISSRPATVNVGNQVAEMFVSPKGERAGFVAHGDVFTAPIEKGAPRNLTRSSNAHDRLAVWSADGRKVLFVSDLSGEEELYTVEQDGNGKPEQITKGHKMRLYQPIWSADAKRIAFADRDGNIHVLKMEDKSEQIVAKEEHGQSTDYQWSPDSQWLAFSLSDKNGANVIYIWGVADGVLHRVTDGLFNCQNPVWDPDGNYLYYLSNREYQPLLSQAEFNYATTRTTGIYTFALRKDVKNPFPPQSDEVSIDDKDAKKPEPAKDAKKDGPAPVKIDFDGLAQRVKRVPVGFENYAGLQATKSYLIYGKFPNGYYGRNPETQTAIMMFGLKDRKESVFLEGANGFQVTETGNKILVRQGGQYALYDCNPKGKDSKKAVSTAALTVDRVPSQEYQQIFNEVWRRYRDFFYVKNMHGYDWEALRRQYSPQLEYVAHRSDLNYIISEMIGELNVGHAYIDGGEYERPARPRVALPGARFELDGPAGRFKISKIFKGQNEEPTYRSPLT
ncbi:MAG: peptidase S41, partial [Bryobacteraceae bacterium]